MKKIFVSYTTMSEEITVKKLEIIKRRLEEFSCPYIEILDKNSSKTQENVINELKSSDILLLLKTDRISESSWVKLEIDYAYEKKIPIISITPNSIINETEECLSVILKLNNANAI